MKLFLVPILLALDVPLAVAQDAHPYSDSTGSMRIESEPAAGDVFLDSLFLGRTPAERGSLTPGTYTVRVIVPGAESWKPVVWEDRIEIRAGERLVVRKELFPPLLVDSSPQGAEILVGDSSVGTTPLFFAPSRQDVRLCLRKVGHDSVMVGLSSLLSQEIVRLPPREVDIRPLVKESPSRREWILLGSGGGMLASGILAAYCKDRANSAFERHLATGDRGQLDASRRYDRLSGAALILAQVSFCLLAYGLLSDP